MVFSMNLSTLAFALLSVTVLRPSCDNTLTKCLIYLETTQIHNFPCQFDYISGITIEYSKIRRDSFIDNRPSPD